MKVVIQRVNHARVSVKGNVVGQCQQGLMLLVGFCNQDQPSIVIKMAEKIVQMRIFEDEDGKMNKSLLEVKGSILAIPQFTLYANPYAGRRPSFTLAANKDLAQPLYNYFIATLLEKGVLVEAGMFGEEMIISQENNGPVTILLDSDFF